MLLAGGQGSRLYVLTENMAKPAVPFGGKFRIIDFPLSNCANAGIDTVGVLTQYRPLELNRYIGSGQPWDLDRADGGVHILPPYQSAGGASWYKGTANAIFQNIGFVDMYDPEYVLILSGDHIYKMNYAKMLAHHKKAGADCTISVMEVPWEDAPRFGIMNVDENDTITEFEEKPAHPKSNLASMGIYVFTWKKLREYLIEDESDEASSNDFGKNIIPKMLKNGEKMAAYRFSGYWKDVGTLDSLWDANMDMLATGSGLDLLEKDWPIYGRSVSAPPAYLGQNAHVEHSVVARGCTVEGEAENSVLSERCTVEEGASVQYSILMPGAVVKKGAVVSYAIVADNGVGVVIEVNSQTDFVAKNEVFQGFVKDVASVIAAEDPADVAALQEMTYPGTDRTIASVTADKVLAIGENIQIRRFVRYAEGVNVPYIHMGGKIGVLVNLAVEGIEAGKVIELGKDVAMQIAAMNPAFLDKSDVSQETLDKEKEIQLAMMANDPKMAAKPEKVKEGIVMGKLGKYYEENCLLQQAFVKENKISVEKHVAAVAKELGGQITVKAFTRFATGEGIEKKEDDFAAEVASMIH